MLLLLSCVHDATNSPAGKTDTAAGGDTEIDASESGAEGSLPADTEGGDTGDSDPPAPWIPGDDVPGWEDVTCAEQHAGRAYSIEYPDVFLAEGSFLDGLPGVGPHLVGLRLRDCALFPCAVDSLDPSVPYVLVELDATGGDEGQARGMGEWGVDEMRRAAGSGRSMLADWATDGSLDALSNLTVCIERMRPDEMRGVVRAEVTRANYPYGVISLYASVVYRFPFDVLLPEHSGLDATQPDIPADQPPGYVTAHYIYEQPYDAAWPWDDIADPSIREQLYERYTPYNMP